MMRVLWTSTVRGLMPRAAAISLACRPCAACSSTSRSRARERGELLASGRGRCKPPPSRRKRALDGRAQLRLVEGLLEEVDRLGLERGARGGHVAVRGDDDEGQRCCRARAALPAARCRSCPEAADPRPRSPPSRRDRRRATPRHRRTAPCGSRRGRASARANRAPPASSSTMKTVRRAAGMAAPGGILRGRPRASSEPPCASAIARLTARPRPMPVGLPETNGSNTRSRLDSARGRGRCRRLRGASVAAPRARPRTSMRCVLPAVDGFDRVGDEVAQHELHLQAVDVQRRQPRLAAHLERDRPRIDDAGRRCAALRRARRRRSSPPAAWCPCGKNRAAGAPPPRRALPRRASCRCTGSSRAASAAPRAAQHERRSRRNWRAR